MTRSFDQTTYKKSSFKKLCFTFFQLRVLSKKTNFKKNVIPLLIKSKPPNLP